MGVPATLARALPTPARAPSTVVCSWCDGDATAQIARDLVVRPAMEALVVSSAIRTHTGYVNFAGFLMDQLGTHTSCLQLRFWWHLALQARRGDSRFLLPPSWACVVHARCCLPDTKR